jgi:hypothetical protein
VVLSEKTKRSLEKKEMRKDWKSQTRIKQKFPFTKVASSYTMNKKPLAPKTQKINFDRPIISCGTIVKFLPLHVLYKTELFII